MASRPRVRDRSVAGNGRAILNLGFCALIACAGSLSADEDPSPDPAIAAATPEPQSEPSRESSKVGTPSTGEHLLESPPPTEKLGPEAPTPNRVAEADEGPQDGTPPSSADPETDPTEDGEPPADGEPPPADDALPERIEVPLAPELQPLERSRWIKHRRAPRESLAQVAHRYGVDESKLRQWNELSPNDPPPKRRKRLRVRARRAPPPRELVEYTVQEGDTWWTIAMRHGVDSRDLRAYNWPRKGKMQPGATVAIWVDPVVYHWVESGPDPVPLDRAHQMRRGAIGIGAPADGILRNGLRVPETPGIHLRLPRSAYGTTHAVEQLVTAINLFHERNDYPLPVELGSMSLPRGGEIGQHKSHQSGRDIDVRLLRKPEISTWKESKGKRVQWDAVWDLVLAFAEVDAVVIFLDYKAQRRLYKAAKARGASDELLDRMIQYPGGHGSSGGLVRHEPGHDSHLHVRFGCGPYETECVRKSR